MAKLVDLKNDAKAAEANEANATAIRKEKHRLFAHGLIVAENPYVDSGVNPAVVYTPTADGLSYEEKPAVGGDLEIADGPPLDPAH